MLVSQKSEFTPYLNTSPSFTLVCEKLRFEAISDPVMIKRDSTGITEIARRKSEAETFGKSYGLRSG